MRARSIRRIGWLAAAFVVVWLLSMTLQAGSASGAIHLDPFSEKRDALACLLAGCPGTSSSLRFLFIDALGNVAVFVPLGAALTLATLPARQRRQRNPNAWRRWLGIATAGALLSLAIEIAQLWIPGRSTDIDDLILNALGTIAGAGAMQVLILMFTR